MDSPLSDTLQLLKRERRRRLIRYVVIAGVALAFGTVEVLSRRPLGGLKTGDPAPYLAASSISDRNPELVALESYRGKVLILDFWASYCATCLHITPALDQLQRDYSDSGLVVLGVSLDYAEDTARARAIHQELGAEYQTIFDVDRSLRSAFNVRLIPLTVLVDRSGHVRWQQEGFINNGGPVLRLASGRGAKALSAALADGR